MWLPTLNKRLRLAEEVDVVGTHGDRGIFLECSCHRRATLDAKGAFLTRATADTIWRVPAYLPYLQPPLTDEAVATAEKQIGYKLPSEYLNLLRKQNGGYIRFSLPEMVHDTIAGYRTDQPFNA